MPEAGALGGDRAEGDGMRESTSGLSEGVQARAPVVIVCPYLRDEDAARVREAFGLDDSRGRALPFFLWQDVERLGPERAYQHCWSQFPEHDVVIVHTDMRPMPDDADNRWYRELLAWVDRLPDAGMVACDLLYPVRASSGRWYVQSAGGRVVDGEISWIGGHVDARTGTVGDGAREYDASYGGVREADWVTFGGVYLRRRMIERCGGLDPRYRWAYVMDVDYCLQARLHGFRCYQVPVNLLHEENGSTRELLAEPAYRDAMLHNFELFRRKWFSEVEIARLHVRIDEQRVESEAARAEVARLRADADRLGSEWEAAEAEVARLRAQSDWQRNEWEAARVDLAATRKRLAERDAELAWVYATRSWRLTAPLRRLNALRRALRARLRRAWTQASSDARATAPAALVDATTPSGVDIQTLLADIRAELQDSGSRPRQEGLRPPVPRREPQT
jgi:hypothetical protein